MSHRGRLPLLRVSALLCGLLAPSGALAQEPVTLTIRPSAGSMAVGELIQVEVAVDSSAGDPEFVADLPAGGFEVVRSSQSRSMEISFGMGRTVQRVRLTLSYILRATTPGIATLGPVTAQVGGATYSSGTARVEVRGSGSAPSPGFPVSAPPAAPPAPPPPPPGAGCRGPSGNPMPAGGSDGPVSCMDPRPSLFLEVSTTDTRVYLGEPLRLQLRAYVERELVGFSVGGLFSGIVQREPALDGFVRANIEPDQIETGTRHIGGRSYIHATIRDKLLYPTRAGRLEIGSAEGYVQLRRIFDVEEVRRDTARIPIEVLPLPSEGRPAGFSPNNVARDLAVSVRLVSGTARAGESVEVEVAIAGEGNLAGFKVSPPVVPGATAAKTADQVVDPTQDSLTGRRTIRFAFVPASAGDLSLPGVGIPYFDYGLGAYRVARAEPLSIAVAPGAASKPPVASDPGDRPGTAAPAAATVSIRLVDDLGSIPAPIHRTAIFWVLLLAPPAALLGTYLVGGAFRIARRRRGIVRPKDLLRRGERALRRVARGKGDGAAAAQFAAVEEALLGYLEARLATPLRGLTSSELRRRLVDAGFPDDLVTQLAVQMEGCDFGRFAPSEGHLQAAGDAARGAIPLLRALDAARLARKPDTEAADARA